MEKKTKNLAITGIQRNQPQGANEACDELVNTRFKNGAWRPIGAKQTVPGCSAKPTYKRIEIHKKDNIENWIGYDLSTKKIEHYDPDTLSVTQTIVTLNGTETLNDIQFLKTFLIIVTTENLYRFVWKNETYTRITLTGIESKFTTVISSNNYIGQRVTEYASDAEELLGKYYKLLNDLSDDGQFIGGFFYRVAIRLFDGSEILQTIPNYYQTVSYNAFIGKNTNGYYLTFSGGAAGFKATISYADILDLTSYALLKDVIQSVVIYASRINQFYDISEDTITDANLATWLPTNTSVNLSTIIDVSPQFKDEMFDSVGWYKIGEISFTDLVQDETYTFIYSGLAKMDIDGYYENFATREQINQDNFSHHELTGNASDIYNNRLELGDTLQTLGLPWDFVLSASPATQPKTTNPYGASPATITYEIDSPNSYDSLIQVKLDTTNGIKYVNSAGTLIAYRNPLITTQKAVFFPGMIGYPDYRAIEVVVNIKISGTYYELYRADMTKSVFSNYSYVVNKDFDKTAYLSSATANRIVDKNFQSIYIPFIIANLTASDIKTEDKVIVDNNRVQISEVNNSFFFPAKNSQQVSTGIIRAFGTNTEDVSSGQYGQYPIYVFTSKGLWAFEIGTGDVYIKNVLPVNGEVIKDNYSKLNLSFGVAYITSEGLKIISGKDVIEISEPVEGIQDQTFSDNLNLRFFLNHASIVEMLNYIDKVPFNTYLSGAVLGYNKGIDNNELIVTNPNYEYSYIYDINNKYWWKMSGQYSVLINNYPELYAVNEDGSGKVVNFSVEETGTTQCLLITRAHNLGEGDVSKKINRAFIKGFLNTTLDHYAAAYVFGSNNLKEWYFITGNDRNTGQFKDVWITRSLVSYRYFIFVFAAELDTSKENYISVIACEYETKMNQKLR